MSFERRLEWILFLAAFLTFGWFNQGGGWNQNGRFAEVRAIVDGGELSIDNYLCYQCTSGSGILRRYPVVNGDVTIDGTTSRLSWVTENGDLLPINGVQAPQNMEEVEIDDLACSGDVSFARGHFHPNKPPGLSFVALPAYFILSHVERLCGRNPDQWWLLTLNAWLTSVFSVGLISAFGVVLVFRIARRFTGGSTRPAFWTAIAFAFGTLFFPFATLLFDHDVTAVLLITAFYCLLPAAEEKAGLTFLAGLAAGGAAITNYVAAVPAAMLGVYLLATRGKQCVRPAVTYGLGMLPPLLAICAYNQACYGSPFALSNHFQNPAFAESGPCFLGMFGVPDAGVALILLISPFRGIFYGAPILLMGCYGLWCMRRTFRAEMWLICGIALTFFLVNSAFMGWHAGFACGPRYLIPATSFLAIPAVYGFLKLPRASGVLLAVSLAINFLFTVTDAESPAGVGNLAMVGNREMYLYSPLTEYAAPLFFQGRAWPLLNLVIAERLAGEQSRLAASNIPPDAQKRILQKLDSSMRESIMAGSDDPLELGGYVGPVSVNPTSVAEGGYFRLFDAGSPQTRWDSFNVGEFLFPESRLSLLPLLLMFAGMAGAFAWDRARAEGHSRAVPVLGGSALPDEFGAE